MAKLATEMLILEQQWQTAHVYRRVQLTRLATQDEREGYFVMFGILGERILICHGSTDGDLSAPYYEACKATIILCCYPKRMIMRYPEFAEKVPEYLRDHDSPICAGLRKKPLHRFLYVVASWQSQEVTV